MASRPNILFITIDSLRYDHTSLGDPESRTTPHLERIADSDRGISFDTCISHAEWTRSSVGTILSGVHPQNHMVGMEQDRVLPEDLTTIAQRLASIGYQTGCLSSNPLIGPELGFTRGFDRAERVEPTLSACLEGLRHYPRVYGEFIARLNTHSVGFTRSLPHSKDFITARIAQRWLGEFNATDEPFFLYLHLNEPHRPYVPAKPFLDAFTEDTELSPTAARDYSLTVHENLYEIIANGCDLTSEQWDALRAMYKSEIAYTDEYIGEIFDFVREQLGDTILVVTSDHGELFGEQGLLAHKIVLRDAITRVPLLIHGLDSLSDQQDNLVQHLDVLKTVLDHVGADSDNVQGINLREDEREYAFSQRGKMGYERDISEFRSYNPDFDAERYHDGVLTAVRSDTHKLLSGDSKTELVDLADETTDVSSQQPEMKEQMESALAEWQADQIQQFEPSFTDSEGQIEDRLESLGYLA